LCSTLSIGRDNVMAILEELSFSKSMLVICHRWWQMNTKNQGKHFPLTITVQGVRSSFWKFYKGWKQRPPFWNWIQVAVDEMAPYDIGGEKKFKNAPSAWKIMATIWGWERRYSWELIASRDDSELWFCIETVWSLNAYLLLAHSTIKMPEALLLHDSARPNATVFTTEAITKFRWMVLLHLPENSDLGPSY
jgi:hypothetical protein